MRAVALVVGLAAAVALRAAGQARFPGEGLAVGAAFGTGLAILAIATWTGERSNARAAAAGAAAGVLVGVGLIVLAAVSRPDLMPALRPAAPFAAWVAVTVLVASSEEAVFRGALFATVDRLAGPFAALLLTTVLFAAMHVPFYGVSALPLDLAVGLVLGGLRLATGGLAAPLAAHLTADIATWWL
jgi:membrane protease YdiL (CAAX protease family)